MSANDPKRTPDLSANGRPGSSTSASATASFRAELALTLGRAYSLGTGTPDTGADGEDSRAYFSARTLSRTSQHAEHPFTLEARGSPACE